MKWPWVSRLAYDLVLDERDRLRAMCDKLTDDIVRIQRTKQGLREAPRPPKERVDLTVPPDIIDMIAGFQSPAVKDEVERQAKQLRANGTPWPEIRKLLETELLEPGPQQEAEHAEA